MDELLGAATRRLSEISESPRLDAELILAMALDVERSYLFAHPEDSPDDAARARVDALLERRLAGEPMAYLAGQKEFWSLPLMVTPDTLVPRPETELLVQLALDYLPSGSDARVLDLGTGSGAIALAVATERPCCSVTATDISPAAIAVARQNARQLQLGNLEFVVSDWASALGAGEFDLAVSNPPYVCDDDPVLQALSHEPRSALAAGADGLRDMRRLADECRSLLKDGGTLMLEHGAEQEHAVAAVLREFGWLQVTCHTDHGGNPRVTVATRPR
ncbi:MAG: peptide chain release factor N(5)-glutamine methyltransferase [Gammaproteobacteria bacterium]|nr:peptide chain release factor N(5)-glutamine methyltransferase [Gammaproteobacteria bacterium]